MDKTDRFHPLLKDLENNFKKKKSTDDSQREMDLFSFKATDELSAIVLLTF